MSREAPEISREEYARRWHALVDGMLSGPDVAPDPKWEEELECICTGPMRIDAGALRLLFVWRPRRCECGNEFRSYTHQDRCWECAANEKEAAKVAKIEREVLRKYGIKPGAESAGGGK